MVPRRGAVTLAQIIENLVIAGDVDIACDHLRLVALFVAAISTHLDETSVSRRHSGGVRDPDRSHRHAMRSPGWTGSHTRSLLHGVPGCRSDAAKAAEQRRHGACQPLTC